MKARRTLFALAVCAGTGFAQQDANPAAKPQAQQETVIVTGTYEPAPLQASDRTVDVIDTGESPLLFRNWADALRLDSSIDLQQRAPGTQADLSIRGSSFGQTLVLVDGFRINDTQSGHHNLDLPIPFESVERIEVLHGSGSTLYGADAVGGAVNFITAPPVRSEVRLGAAAGNYGSNSQNGSAALLGGNWSEQLAFTRDFSSGFIPDRDYRNFAASSETRSKSALGNGDLLLGLSDRPFGANQFYGNFNSWERTKGWFLAASQQIASSTQLVFAYRRHTDEFILLRDHPEVYENNHITQSWQGAIRARYKISENNRVYYGTEIFEDAIDSNNLGNHSRTRGAGYVDFDARALRRWSVSGGVREEFFSGSLKQFTPELTTGFAISSNLRLKGSISRAFRLPSYTDLYYHDPANVGNPNLRPETAVGFEGGVEWTSGSRWAASATVFQRREHDVIDYVRANTASLWQAVNIEDINFTGFEGVIRARVANAQSLALAYTGLYGAQQSLAGLQSQYVFNYPINQVTANWLGSMPHAISFRLRAGMTQRYQTDPYPLVEMALTHDFHWVQPYAQISNLTNTGYEEIQGVRMPGRSYLVGLQLRPGQTSRSRRPRVRN